MKTDEKRPARRNHVSDVAVLAVILILIGLIMVGYRTGIIDPYIYRICISWQMLLIVLGVWSLIRTRWANGVLLVGVGSFLMIPLITGSGKDWIGGWWPMIFVIIGVVILIQLLVPRRDKPGGHRGCPGSGCNDEDSSYTDDGFINTNNVFGAVKQIVLDPVFKGANIRTVLGGTVIDLRHTTIADGETYIDIECILGGVEIFVPQAWSVIAQVRPILGGCEDKRFPGAVQLEPGHRIVIRGSVTLGGIEIKS